MTNERFEKLRKLLEELFQLDQPELDFGFYRIMHACREQVTRFLCEELLPQVREALDLVGEAGSAGLKEELREAEQQARSLGADPGDLPKVRELRRKLAETPDLDWTEADVLDHLYRFFRRYYSDGDFLSQRVYKDGVYAIPYQGEEVTLHWANSDQYYIKTDEYLRHYAFRLRPGEKTGPMRVRFRLRDAAEGEHGNVKPTADAKRVFILWDEDFLREEPGEQGPELVVDFGYRPATLGDWPEADGARRRPPAQKDLLGLAEKRILARLAESPALHRWVRELEEKPTRADGTTARHSRLRAHLDRYTKRNTTDYFIHKDLGGFLRRELDFFIKNEVMRLDDIEHETAPRAEQYLAKIRAIRGVAGKVIDFLAQLENFQKRLWLKKKFVVETSWLVRLDCVPDEFLPEIAANDAQRREWVDLCAINEVEADLASPGYTEPLAVEFLKAHPSLMVDTRHFDDSAGNAASQPRSASVATGRGSVHRGPDRASGPATGALPSGPLQHGVPPSAASASDGPSTSPPHVSRGSYHASFSARLLETLDDLGAGPDGLLVHSENSQALSLMRSRYRERIGCIYIDPPYNTELDRSTGKFTYKDGYASSTWCSMIAERARQARNLLRLTGAQYTSIDDVMYPELLGLLGHEFGRANHIATVVWEKVHTRKNSAAHFSVSHDYIPVFARAKKSWDRVLLPRENISAYKNPDGDPKGPWKADPVYANKPYDANYRITKPNGVVLDPPAGQYWRLSEDSWQARACAGEVIWGESDSYPMVKRYLAEVQDGLVPVTLFKRTFAGDNARANAELKGLFGLGRPFPYPKPTLLVQRLLQTNVRPSNASTVLDYFAGSGTTGHAVINLNRGDGGNRRFILVEMGRQFDTVLVPRLKKVTYSPEWKDGKPIAPRGGAGRGSAPIRYKATAEEVERSPRLMQVLRLESFEDTLNNLRLPATSSQTSGRLPHATARSESGSAAGSPHPESPAVANRAAPPPDNFVAWHEGSQLDRQLRQRYPLRYTLDIESRQSASLLDLDQFRDPWNYRLLVKRPGADESRETRVDLVETFNWLLGLRDIRRYAPRRWSADLHVDEHDRLTTQGRLRGDPEGLWRIQAVEGVLPDGGKALVIWRNRPGEASRAGDAGHPGRSGDRQLASRGTSRGGAVPAADAADRGPETHRCIEADNAVLDAWFEERQYRGASWPTAAPGQSGPDRRSPDEDSVAKTGGTPPPFLPDVIFVNGDCNLPSRRPAGATWRVDLTEDRFLHLMFGTDDAE